MQIALTTVEHVDDAFDLLHCVRQLDQLLLDTPTATGSVATLGRVTAKTTFDVAQAVTQDRLALGETSNFDLVLLGAASFFFCASGGLRFGTAGSGKTRACIVESKLCRHQPCRCALGGLPRTSEGFGAGLSKANP